MSKKENELKPYVVCYEPKNVYFGYAKDLMEFTKYPVTLRNARCLVWWSRKTKAIINSAKIGPQEGSNVSPSVEEHFIFGKIESVTPCTEEAMKQWEKGIWSDSE